MTGITFDSNSLQTDSIITESIRHEDIPNPDIRVYALSHANRSSIPRMDYPNRRVIITGKLISNTIANTDLLIDTFKSYFRGKEKNLDIDYGGGTRRYIATRNRTSIDRPNGLKYARFEVEFVCSYPFGRNTSLTTALSATGRTLSSYSDAHTFLGTAPFQQPIVTITINSVTGGASFMSFGNDGNGQGITITDHTFIAGDVVVIDTLNHYVKINDVEVAFLGAFPEFEPGAQTMSYTDGFTTRDFDVQVQYYQEFL